ncbi:sarcosine oxidase subunit delta [Oricola sp.]|uniref:sarcosine oxidase subunit delta n=1 Tax=Oricola sp. TaxID=1979950 RepID=UPI0025CDC5DE|nr:sarcosine oxidase subunit delta [Oricola sp.]MCI5076196.1 sarcosine oxidase subunit delta [Oricola sp.]
MIITCPHCGPRDLAEFSYKGDATRTRPGTASGDLAHWNAYVYERENPAGQHREFWQHTGGCRKHLIVTRDTLTHAISHVEFPPTKAPRRSGA